MRGTLLLITPDGFEEVIENKGSRNYKGLVEEKR